MLIQHPDDIPRIAQILLIRDITKNAHIKTPTFLAGKRKNLDRENARVASPCRGGAVKARVKALGRSQYLSELVIGRSDLVVIVENSRR